MASNDLDQILAVSGVSPTLASEMISAGWTRASYGMCASSPSELDQHWEEIFPDHTLSLLQKAQLRRRLSCEWLGNHAEMALLQMIPMLGTLQLQPRHPQQWIPRAVGPRPLLQSFQRQLLRQ